MGTVSYTHLDVYKRQDQNLAYQSYQALSVLLQAVLEHKLPEKEYYHPASPILNAETV